MLDLFIGTLKDNIQHDVLLFEPSSLEKAFMMARKVESKNMTMTTRKSFSNAYRENNVPSSKPPKRLAHQQLDEEGVVIYIPIMCNQFLCEYIPRDIRVLFMVTNPLVPYKLSNF